MDESEKSIISNRIASQRDFLQTGKGKEIAFRLEKLKKLKSVISLYEGEIGEALLKDLHKTPYETYLTEISIVNHELDTHIRNLKKWAGTKRPGTPFFLFPSKSRIIKEPYGLVLIISPWNYPFQLLMAPLVSAIAAGNVVALKPSHKTPVTSLVIEKIVREVFEEGYAECYIGETEISNYLLAQRFDHIFFTGSPKVGKIVMEAASKNLTPVTLELGGKSPCIVDKTADLDTAARRIIWGKLINAGQTCIAPDYMLVHRDVKKELLDKMVLYIEKFYGADASTSEHYPRIITKETVERLSGLIRNENIYYGGKYDRESRYFQPTLLDGVSPESLIMQEEIFGPILPVLEIQNLAEAAEFINSREKPLALYFFGKKDEAEYILENTSSGGACINDTLLHIANSKMPFGGVGNSGMGNYHGKYGFDTFSHTRSVLISKNKIDFSIKFPPYKNIKLLKKLM